VSDPRLLLGAVLTTLRRPIFNAGRSSIHSNRFPFRSHCPAASIFCNVPSPKSLSSNFTPAETLGAGKSESSVLAFSRNSRRPLYHPGFWLGERIPSAVSGTSRRFAEGVLPNVLYPELAEPGSRLDRCWDGRHGRHIGSQFTAVDKPRFAGSGDEQCSLLVPNSSFHYHALLTYVIAFNLSLSAFLSGWTVLETSLGAIARLKDFEAETGDENKPWENIVPSENWPSRGLLEIEAVCVEYK
jgi:hypothetical protein